MRRATIAGFILCQACAVADLTEVVVIIEPEPGIRMRSQSLSIKVTTAPSPMDAPPLLENSNAPWNNGRYTIAISPKNPHAAGRYVVEASALEGSQPIATARLISGFVLGQTRYVRMLLEDQCVGMLSCGSGTTCRGGACVDAEVDPTRFAPSSDLAPTTNALSPVTVDPADAAVSAAPDAAATVAGSRDASTDTSAPRVRDASMSEANVRADAEAEADADADAGRVLPVDPHRQEQDAGAPAVPETARCKPGYYEGTWMGDYTYTGFGVKTNTKIEPISTTNAPVLSLVLLADGASKLRVGAGCVSSTMVAPPSRRPFKARLSGSLDCATGELSGSLRGLYIVLTNTGIEYPFAGSFSAQLEPESSSLRDGAWNAAEPHDPNGFNEGSGQGSWSASWKSEAAPSVSTDPCIEVPSSL